MTSEFTMGAGGVPADTYPLAEFVGVEDFNNQYGPGVKLRWSILEGEHAGQEATRICSPNMSLKSALGKMAVALKGGPIAIGERFSFGQYVGVRGSLIVEPTDNGGSRVSAFLRQQATPQQAPPPAPPQPQAPPQQAPPPPPAPPQPQQPAAPSDADMEAFRRWQATQQGQASEGSENF